MLAKSGGQSYVCDTCGWDGGGMPRAGGGGAYKGGGQGVRDDAQAQRRVIPAGGRPKHKGRAGTDNAVLETP